MIIQKTPTTTLKTRIIGILELSCFPKTTLVGRGLGSHLAVMSCSPSNFYSTTPKYISGFPIGFSQTPLFPRKFNG